MPTVASNNLNFNPNQLLWSLALGMGQSTGNGLHVVTVESWQNCGNMVTIQSAHQGETKAEVVTESWPELNVVPLSEVAVADVFLDLCFFVKLRFNEGFNAEVSGRNFILRNKFSGLGVT